MANDGGKPFRMPLNRIGIRFLQSYGIKRQHMVPSFHYRFLRRFHHFLHILQRKPTSLANRMLSGFHWLCFYEYCRRTCFNTAWLCSHGQGLDANAVDNQKSSFLSTTTCLHPCFPRPIESPTERFTIWSPNLSDTPFESKLWKVVITPSSPFRVRRSFNR